MELKDLKNGFLVETRGGELYRVMRDYPCKLNKDGTYEYKDTFLDNWHYDYFDSYYDNLTYCVSEDLDIVKVYQQEPGKSNYNLLWERKEFNGHNDCLNLLYNMGYRYITVEQDTFYAYKEAVNFNAPIDATREPIQLFAGFFAALSPDFYYKISQYDNEDGGNMLCITYD